MSEESLTVVFFREGARILDRIESAIDAGEPGYLTSAKKTPTTSKRPPGVTNTTEIVT
ncbi:MAG TPA: hypothetical protein VGM94_13200 [Galbitalea sp.]|jgi:hypothetical protein